ncbi:GGDEF domain-containing protein [Halioxenophilus sp. WMMB6]|uniref:GGDEF domain-containing protein n=1 Tax=Halioxenophilus sp. WMMB6 TaxID=3073815 RepID=UPI00295ED2D2|nr:GGDEF domain-containing protein [Halioxenophilus sp. WMMB6]
MKHQHSVELAAALSSKAQEFLAQQSLPFTPINFAVAYEIAMGKNQALVKAAAELTQRNLLDSYRCHDLYFTHIDLRTDARQRFLQQLSGLVSDMLGTYQHSAKTVSQYQAQLQAGEQALADPADPKRIIEALIKATQAVRADQQKLVEELARAEAEVKELKSNLHKMELEAITDSLSVLVNRKGLEKLLSEQPLQGQGSSLALFDIDHFKKINDTYGHVFGDHVIKQVAAEIKNHIRGADIASRWGGEEFLVVLRETELKGALIVADKIRESIKALRWKNTRTGEQLPPVTLSGGVTQIRQNERMPKDLDTAVERADQALYKAKERGRNKVCS